MFRVARSTILAAAVVENGACLRLQPKKSASMDAYRERKAQCKRELMKLSAAEFEKLSSDPDGFDKDAEPLAQIEVCKDLNKGDQALILVKYFKDAEESCKATLKKGLKERTMKDKNLAKKIHQCKQFSEEQIKKYLQHLFDEKCRAQLKHIIKGRVQNALRPVLLTKEETEINDVFKKLREESADDIEKGVLSSPICKNAAGNAEGIFAAVNKEVIQNAKCKLDLEKLDGDTLEIQTAGNFPGVQPAEFDKIKKAVGTADYWRDALVKKYKDNVKDLKELTFANFRKDNPKSSDVSEEDFDKAKNAAVGELLESPSDVSEEEESELPWVWILSIGGGALVILVVLIICCVSGKETTKGDEEN